MGKLQWSISRDTVSTRDPYVNSRLSYVCISNCP